MNRNSPSATVTSILSSSNANSLSQARPAVLLIGFNDFQNRQMIRDLDKQNIEGLCSNQISEMIPLIMKPQTRLIVICDRLVKNPFNFIQSARTVSSAKWILISEKQNISFRCQAVVGLGVEEVLSYSAGWHTLLGTILAILEQELKNTSPINKQLVTHKTTISPAKDFDFSDTAIISLKNDLTYFHQQNKAPFKQDWPSLDSYLLKEFIGNQKKSSQFMNDILLKLQKDCDNEGRFSLITFGVRSALIEGTPKEFIVLNSTDQLPDPRPLATAAYPELLEGLKAGTACLSEDVLDSSVFYPIKKQLLLLNTRSVASIPLMNQQNQIFAAIKIRFPNRASEDTKHFIQDLLAYSKKIAPIASYLDFVGRIYAGSGIQSARAWKI
jgi:hypothetical protein